MEVGGVEWSRLASKAGTRHRKWAAETETKSERFGEHLLPDRVWMSSWYRAGYGWPLTDGSANGRRSGSWDNRSKDEWFCLKFRMEPWRLGAIWLLIFKVLSWNVVRDLSVSQIPMLTAWELIAGVSGAHELYTSGKLCCLIKQKNLGKTADGLQVGVASMATMASMDHVAPMASMAAVGGVGIKVAQVMGLQKKSMGTSLRTTKASRVPERSGSLHTGGQNCRNSSQNW